MLSLARIIAAAANCVGGYILSPYRPKLHFETAKARELWRFGKWIYGSNIIGYMISRGDTYFVWSYLGLPQLALYKYAFDFATMPATQIAGVISSVSFPAYSKIQNDIPRLREAYLKVLKVTVIVCCSGIIFNFFIWAGFCTFISAGTNVSYDFHIADYWLLKDLWHHLIQR